MDGTHGAMKLINLRRVRMENNSPLNTYDKVDPDEIIKKLKELLYYLQKMEQDGKL
jgi:hypothetical protein